jgi:TonB family protein
MMNLKHLLTLCLLTASLGLWAAPQNARPPLSKDEVLDLLASSAPGKVIVATIEKYGIAFDPTDAVLEEFRKSGADKAVLAALRQAWHTEIPKPLSATEIRMLLTADALSENISRLVLERGVDFQPTAAYLDEIRSEGGKDVLVETLRNATPRAFSKEELLQLLGTRMDQNGIAQRVRQRGIEFDPGNANLQALRSAGARAPLLETVRTAKHAKPFVARTSPGPTLGPSLVQGKTVALICSSADPDVPVFAEPDNLGKIAARLPCGGQVTFLERLVVPQGVDKIQYADGKEGFVASAYLETPVATPGGDVSMPTAIYKPDAGYTLEARHARIEGTVKLLIAVDAAGNVSDVQESSELLGGGLDKSAMDTVRKWKFIPAKRNGVPVAVRVGVEVTFRLSGQAH